MTIVSLPTGQQVADFLGAGASTALVAQANVHVPMITALARSYTRGNGFEGVGVSDDIAAVIVTASARMIANPEQIERQVGTVAIRGGFKGWSLVELAVLNAHRGVAA